MQVNNDNSTSLLESISSTTTSAAAYTWRGYELMVVAPGVFDASRTVFQKAQKERESAVELQNNDQSKEAAYANMRSAGWMVLSVSYAALAGVIAADAICGWTHNLVQPTTDNAYPDYEGECQKLDPAFTASLTGKNLTQAEREHLFFVEGQRIGGFNGHEHGFTEGFIAGRLEGANLANNEWQQSIESYQLCSKA